MKKQKKIKYRKKEYNIFSITYNLIKEGFITFNRKIKILENIHDQEKKNKL